MAYSVFLYAHYNKERSKSGEVPRRNLSFRNVPTRNRNKDKNRKSSYTYLSTKKLISFSLLSCDLLQRYFTREKKDRQSHI
jgi:hypothetical protein